MSDNCHIQAVKSYIVNADMLITAALNTQMILMSVLLAGTSSGTPLFVQTGKDLLLHVEERVEMKKGSDFKWSFNGSTNIVKFFAKNDPIINDDYEGRVEFSVQNYILCLKNVQKADSGRYTATVSGNKDQVVADYKVTVLGKFLNISNVAPQQQPVSKPSHLFIFQIQCLQLI